MDAGMVQKMLRTYEVCKENDGVRYWEEEGWKCRLKAKRGKGEVEERVM